VQGCYTKGAVADNEHYSPDSPTGLPKVTPDDIEALKQPHNFEEDFRQFQRDYPEIARDISTGIQGLDQHALEIKRAFAKGAIYMYLLLKRAAQTSELEAHFNAPASDDDVDDEDPPLSA
jgi:hypothetical protein